MGKEVKMHSNLVAYRKQFPNSVNPVLETHDGDKALAIQSINTLFEVVEKERNNGLPNGNTRNYGGGVGLNELKPAAEIGVALGVEALENILYVVVKEDRVLTTETATEILGRINSY